MLALGDLSDYSEKDIFNHLVKEYTAPANICHLYKIHIAYESVGDYGCDSNSFFLLEDISTNKLFTVYGSHCSCNGFENQFDLEETSLNYLNSNSFYLVAGGYDNRSEVHKTLIKAYLKEMLDEKIVDKQKP